MLFSRSSIVVLTASAILVRFITGKHMKDTQWPGWGSGILGDCGSLDPGSNPGPGPFDRSVLREPGTAMGTFRIGFADRLSAVGALVLD